MSILSRYIQINTTTLTSRSLGYYLIGKLSEKSGMSTQWITKYSFHRTHIFDTFIRERGKGALRPFMQQNEGKLEGLCELSIKEQG